MGTIDTAAGGNVFRSGVGIGVFWLFGATDSYPGEEEDCDKE
jgi:hypothetical protein